MDLEILDGQNVDPDDVLQWLLNNAQFAASTTSRERCYCACKLLREETVPPVSYSVLGKALGLNPSTVMKNHAKFATKGSEISKAGCPSILSFLIRFIILPKGIRTFGHARRWRWKMLDWQ
jgi:hypothetical protein